MDIILIGIGGGIGAVLRFSLGNFIKSKTRADIPINTMIINILGSLLLGICLAKISNHHYSTLLETGVMGGFTTYSTFMVEGFNLYKDARLLEFLQYIIPTVVLGIIGFVIGFSL